MYHLLCEVFFFCSDEKWKELSVEERQEKEQFLKNEEHVSKSFMEMVCRSRDKLGNWLGKENVHFDR